MQLNNYPWALICLLKKTSAHLVRLYCSVPKVQLCVSVIVFTLDLSSLPFKNGLK